MSDLVFAVVMFGSLLVVAIVSLVGLAKIFNKLGKEVSRKKQLYLDCYLEFRDWEKCDDIIDELNKREK